ncbi:MAG: O-antigen ligase family protein [Phormidesmis sp.]
MALIKQNNRLGRRPHAWLASVVLLPYVSYAGLLLMLGLLLSAMFQRGKQVWRLCGQQGLGWLTAGLLLSASFGINRGDAFLQLTNFLPFFVLFGAIATIPTLVAQPFDRLGTVAEWLLVSAVPMNLIAIAEYILKFDRIAGRVQAMPLPAWFLNWLYVPDFGHRAHSLFSHPNTLSAYLAIVLGLGLGVILKALNQPATRGTWIQGLAVALCLVAIFCTGSRNGVLIALMLIAIALYAARRHRGVMLCGLVGGSGIVAAVMSFGIGGRSLSMALLITQDPRVGVWQLAIKMIQQRPWLGWGLSGLRETYEPGSIPGYDTIFHAHNVWLFLASETGIPVMLGFCLFVGMLYYNSVRTAIKGSLPTASKAVLLGYLMALTSCLLFGLFDVVLFDARLNVLAWGLLASLYVMSHHNLAKPDTFC